jgi:hypothetical protein
VLDAEAVVQWIVEHRVDLVLHGHMHKAFVARVERPVKGDPDPSKPWHAFHVAGLSSTGVDKKHADDDNAFALLTFSDKEVVINWYTLDPKKKSKKKWQVNIPYDGSRS